MLSTYSGRGSRQFYVQRTLDLWVTFKLGTVLKYYLILTLRSMSECVSILRWQKNFHFLMRSEFFFLIQADYVHYPWSYTLYSWLSIKKIISTLKNLKIFASFLFQSTTYPEPPRDIKLSFNVFDFDALSVTLYGEQVELLLFGAVFTLGLLETLETNISAWLANLCRSNALPELLFCKVNSDVGEPT